MKSLSIKAPYSNKIRIALKCITLSIGLLSFCTQARAQDPVKSSPWETLLKDVKIEYFYSDFYDTYLPKPKFGKGVKALNDKRMRIKGFNLPIDITGDVFVLSYNPMAQCFFCTGNGMETIMEIIPKDNEFEKFKNLKTDDYILVEGIFRANKNDYEHLIYILDEVTLVKIEQEGQ